MSRHVAIGLCVFIILLFVAVVGVGAVPPLPVTFWGPVYVDGAPVPIGTPVVAWVGDTPYPATRAMSGTVPAYVVNVGGSETWDPSAGAPPEEGAVIVFKIGDLVADQQPPWHQGDRHPNYALTASSSTYSRYDLDHNCEIDVVDIMAVAADWRCSLGDACYDPLHDFDDDGDIDIVDIMVVASRWGCACGDDCYDDGASMIAGSPGQSESALRPAVVRLEPLNSMVAPGKPFTVVVQLEGGMDLGGFQVALNFDPALLKVDGVTLSDFLGSTKRDTVPLGPQVDNEAGRVTFGGFSFGNLPGPDGSGALAVVTLGSRLVRESPLRLENVQIVDTRGRVQGVTIEDGGVTMGVLQRIYLPLQIAAMGSQAQAIVPDGESHIMRDPLSVYLPVIVRR